MFSKFKRERARLQIYTSIILPAVLIGGWFYPPLGLSLLLCMAGAVGIALYNGRAWCDWMCPRGSFYDLFLDRLSRRRNIPGFFKTNWFRFLILSGLFASLGIQIYYAWGNSHDIGLAFVTVLTVTTTAGIALGSFFKPRAWCQICPMGTIGNWISRGKNPLHVSETCKDCKLCAKVCPMQLKPYENKSDSVTDGDCIKCGSCVAICPISALGFEKQTKKAA
jgi:ferredoxin-type protein NapH